MFLSEFTGNSLFGFVCLSQKGLEGMGMGREPELLQYKIKHLTSGVNVTGPRIHWKYKDLYDVKLSGAEEWRTADRTSFDFIIISLAFHLVLLA